MPNVSPYELYGNNGSTWVAPTSVSGNDGSWEYGFAVYYHNGTDWVEVWNARPEVVSTSMATTSTGLTFTGTADPNNFATTAKFEYKEVGAGSYSNSGTTSTGMGDGVDGAVSYTVTATEGDTFKNWEARASATNTAGTGNGSTLTLDCRKHDAGGSGWTSTPSVETTSDGCDSCGTKSRTNYTYTKSGCQQYVVYGTYGSCSGSWTNMETSGTYNGVAYTAFYSLAGGGYFFYKNSDPTNGGGGNCVSGSEYDSYVIEQCSANSSYRVTYVGCVNSSSGGGK